MSKKKTHEELKSIALKYSNYTEFYKKDTGRFLTGLLPEVEAALEFWKIDYKITCLVAMRSILHLGRNCDVSHDGHKRQTIRIGMIFDVKDTRNCNLEI